MENACKINYSNDSFVRMTNREQAIVDAAARLVRQHGHGHVTIEAVAQEAEVAKGTVYLYFANKAALADAVAARFLSRLCREVCNAVDRRARWIELVQDSSAEALLVAARAVSPSSGCHESITNVARELGLADDLRVYALIGVSLALVEGSSSEFEEIWSALFPADDAWLATREKGWVPIPLPDSMSRHGFVSGGNDHRIRIRYFGAGDVLKAKVLLGADAQGPPGHAHGGSLAAVLDEAMGGAAWMNGHPVVAAELRVRFRQMLPLGTRCIVSASVCETDGRKVSTRGALTDEEGVVYAEGDATFIELSHEAFGEMGRDAFEAFQVSR